MIAALFHLRPFSDGDEAAAREVMNAESRALGRGDDYTAAEWRAFLETPGMEPAHDLVLAVTEADIPVGVGTLEYEYDGDQQAIKIWADCGVEPAHCGLGIGTALIAWGEARALALADERAAVHIAASAEPHAEPGTLPIRMRRLAAGEHVEGKAILEANAYPLLRVFHQMRIELAGWQETAPALPAGLELRPVDFEQHGEAIYQAHQDIWRDHWGFTPETLAHFRQAVYESPSADASLCQMVWDTRLDQIAAFTICHPYSDEKHDVGWVKMLATRRAYRKQGLGRALLLSAFAEFQRRGYEAVRLAVDADSPTGALGLYEHAGMHVQEQRLVYEKMLR